MSKSYKPKDGNYIDSTGIVHGRTKLSDILNYSDTEKIVGTWFGKPLYRKNYDITTISNQDRVEIDYLPIANLIFVIGQARFEYRDSGVFYSRNLNVNDLTMGNARTTWESDAPTLVYTRANYNSAYNLRGLKISAYYTKTTD